MTKRKRNGGMIATRIATLTATLVVVGDPFLIALDPPDPPAGGHPGDDGMNILENQLTTIVINTTANDLLECDQCLAIEWTQGILDTVTGT